MGRGKTKDGVWKGRGGAAGRRGEKGTGGCRDGKREDEGWSRKEDGWGSWMMGREWNWRGREGKREDAGWSREGEGERLSLPAGG